MRFSSQPSPFFLSFDDIFGDFPLYPPWNISLPLLPHTQPLPLPPKCTESPPPWHHDKRLPPSQRIKRSLDFVFSCPLGLFPPSPCCLICNLVEVFRWPCFPSSPFCLCATEGTSLATVSLFSDPFRKLVCSPVLIMPFSFSHYTFLASRVTTVSGWAVVHRSFFADGPFPISHVFHYISGASSSAPP